MKKIFLNNFRGFKNQKFDFSRINIIIGENSGGKSSFLKFLLTLSQTIDDPYQSNFKLKGPLVDLGNFNETIYKREKGKKIEFGFSENTNYINFFLKFLNKIDDDSPLKSKEIVDLLNTASNFDTKISFKITEDLNNHSSIQTIIENEGLGKIQFKSIKNKDDSLPKNQKTNLIFDFNFIKGGLRNLETNKSGFFTLFEDFKDNVEEVYSEYNYKKIYCYIVFLIVFQNYCIKEIESIRFPNPISKEPQRIYFLADKNNDYQKFNIEKVVNTLGNIKNIKHYQEKIDDLNRLVQKLGIADEIRLRTIDESVTKLEVKNNNFWVNITDVGYGVSLQIPILLQALLSELYTPSKETILIEQPEIHLHPKLQSEFINTLLSIGNKNRYFIETHSEHIVRKLQVLIKKKQYNLKPEDVTIHYFKNSAEKFIVTSHKINEDGKLDPPFPSGFYDSSYNLIKELM